MPVRRWFFPRYFIFRDASGAEIGRAGSLWVLLDIHTRKMTKPDLIQSLMLKRGANAVNISQVFHL